MKEANMTILTPYISLDTPGKATVQVVILADPVIDFNFFWQCCYPLVKLVISIRLYLKKTLSTTDISMQHFGSRSGKY